MANLKKMEAVSIKWGKVGDFVQGTILEKKVIKDQTNPFTKAVEDKMVYTVEASMDGFFHDDKGKKKVAFVKGDLITVWGRSGIDRWMEMAHIGQEVRMEYTGNYPTKSGIEGKTIDVSLDKDFKPTMIADEAVAELGGKEDDGIPFGNE